MRDFKGEKRKKRGLLLIVAAIIAIALVILLSKIHPYKSTIVETGETQVETSTPSDSDSTDGGTRVADGIRKATDSNAWGYSDELKEKLENERGISEDIIREIRKQNEEEGIDPQRQAEAWEQSVIEKVQREHEQQISESLLETEQGTEQITETQENETAVETDPNGNEYERQFNYKDPITPTMDADGVLEKTFVERVEDVMNELPDSGPVITENTSTSMNMRQTVIKNLYTSDIGRDRIGDTVMLGDLAVKVEPTVSETGYEIKTYGNTAELTFPEKGTVLITKVNSGFRASDLSIRQLIELGGIEVIDEEKLIRPSSGTYSNTSYRVVSKGNTRAIQYYQCPVGTYQMLFISAPRWNAEVLAGSVKPDETINSAPTSEYGFTVSE